VFYWIVFFFLVFFFLMVVLARGLRRQGKIALRWWALPVMATAVLLSLQSIVLIILDYFLGSLVLGLSRPALWIQDAWGAYSWPLLLMLSWIVGLVVVLGFKGVTFSTPDVRKGVLRVSAAFMVPMCLLNALAYFLTTHGVFAAPVHIAVAASPDGSRRVHAYRTNWLDVSYELVSEPNERFPLLARSLGGTGFMSAGPAWGAESKRLAWSIDSQVVALWLDKTPIMAYDFSKLGQWDAVLEWNQEVTSPADREAEQEAEAAEFRARLARLMADHGGPAP